MKPTTIGMELRDTKYRVMSERIQHTLLAPFKHLSGSAVQLHITGMTPDVKSAQELKVSIGPKIIWIEAIRWKVFETLVSIREIADTAMGDGDLERGIDLYSSVAFSAKRLYIGQEIQMPDPLEQPTPDAEKCVILLTLDCFLCAAFAMLRLQEVVSFRGHCAALADFVHNNHQIIEWKSSDVKNALVHITLLDPKNQTNTMASLLERSEKVQDLYLAHDAANLRRFPDHSVVAGPEHLPLEEIPACKLPPRIFDFRSGSGVPQKPARLVNYVDVEHYANLTVEEKDRIPTI